MNKTIKLPNAITIALGQYFLNRQLSHTQETGRTYYFVGDEKKEEIHTRKGRPWDKKADLDRIIEACQKHGWTFQACAGTFWFHSPRSKCRYYIINENMWPVAKVEENKGLHGT